MRNRKFDGSLFTETKALIEFIVIMAQRDDVAFISILPGDKKWTITVKTTMSDEEWEALDLPLPTLEVDEPDIGS